MMISKVNVQEHITRVPVLAGELILSKSEEGYDIFLMNGLLVELGKKRYKRLASVNRIANEYGVEFAEI